LQLSVKNNAVLLLVITEHIYKRST